MMSDHPLYDQYSDLGLAFGTQFEGLIKDQKLSPIVLAQLRMFLLEVIETGLEEGAKHAAKRNS